MKYLTMMLIGAILSLASVEGQAQEQHLRGQNLLDPDIDRREETVAPPDRDAPVVGTVELRGGTAAAGIGYVWGHGVLKMDGRNHAFKIHGLSILDVGGSHIEAKGDVMHLHSLKDFAGRYAEFGAGVTLAEGGSVIYLKNQRGVVVKLTAKSQGLRFHLAAGGIKVSMAG